MPEIEIELDTELWKAIDELRGELSRGEFIELSLWEILKTRGR